MRESFLIPARFPSMLVYNSFKCQEQPQLNRKSIWHLRLPKNIMMQSQKVLLQSPFEHSINALKHDVLYLMHIFKNEVPV